MKVFNTPIKLFSWLLSGWTEIVWLWFFPWVNFHIVYSEKSSTCGVVVAYLGLFGKLDSLHSKKSWFSNWLFILFLIGCHTNLLISNFHRIACWNRANLEAEVCNLQQLQFWMKNAMHWRHTPANRTFVFKTALCYLCCWWHIVILLVLNENVIVDTILINCNFSNLFKLFLHT